MPSARFRLSAAAAVAVLGAGLFLAGPASAAPGTTITLDPSDVVMSEEVLNASGTCAAGRPLDSSAPRPFGRTVLRRDAINVVLASRSGLRR